MSQWLADLLNTSLYANFVTYFCPYYSTHVIEAAFSVLCFGSVLTLVFRGGNLEHK